MEVNIHHAKTNLSKLISAAESGEEVIIARNGKPAVRLVVVQEQTKSRRDLIGSCVGKMWISPDFDSPETSEELADLFENTRDI